MSCASGPQAFWVAERGEAALLPDLPLPFLTDHSGNSGTPATPYPSQPHQPRPVNRHTWQPLLGEGLWGTGDSLEQRPSLCLCLAQWEAVLPQAMLWGSLRTQG